MKRFKKKIKPSKSLYAGNEAVDDYSPKKNLT